MVARRRIRSTAGVIITLGPAIFDRKSIKKASDMGVGTVRINLSHNTREWHTSAIELIRSVADGMAIMLDLQGPKIRVGRLRDSSVYLKNGTEVILREGDGLGDENVIYVPYEGFRDLVSQGDTILLDDGLIRLKVISIQGGDVVATVLEGGILYEHKGINLPHSRNGHVGLSAKDREDIKFGVDMDVDIFAVSFVHSHEDVQKVKDIIDFLGGKQKVLAKIEKPQALKDLDDIAIVSDGMIVARGDLGIEVPIERVPLLQREIITAGHRRSKPVVVATQLLESMIRNPIPTRAEVSDIAHAVMDGADALMLSGETAVGRHPFEAIKYLQRIMKESERHIKKDLSLPTPENADLNEAQGISLARAAISLAYETGARAIVAYSHSGKTPLRIARFMHRIPVIAMTPCLKTYRYLRIVRSVYPILISPQENFESLIVEGEKRLMESGLVRAGDLVVIIGGVPLRVGGRTNILKVHNIGSGYWESRDKV